MVPLTLFFAMLFGLQGDAYTQAAAAFQSGHYQQALSLLDSYEAPTDQRAAKENLRSLALMELHRYDAALAASEAARGLDRDNVNYICNAGIIYLAKQDFHSAEKLFNDAIRDFPKASRLYEGLGEALFAVRRFSEAQTQFLKAVELDPQSPSAQLALAKLYFTIADHDKLEGTARKAVELAPDSFLACYFYGRHLIEDRGDRVAGRTYLQRTVTLAPTFTDGLLFWAKLLVEEQNWTEAIETYQKAIASDASDPRPYYGLFLMYRKQGNRQKVEWALQKFRELQSNSAAKQ
jgi:tetratricopeptide (TPR) repeat protein